ncbi:hypothetical protein ACLF3G_10405 [Falsiroseomonas sp. HC035]|uniref:PqqD family protein n=1 Tax=Falsiroseomonas sp. HC035 TaxID=3390999 RepID=UPI003D31BC19
MVDHQRETARNLGGSEAAEAVGNPVLDDAPPGVAAWALDDRQGAPRPGRLGPGRLVRAPGMRFGVMAGRNILFSAADQKLFEINDAAAHLWRCVEDGLGQQDILDELAAAGLEPGAARRHLDAAIHEWTRLDFIRQVPEPSPGRMRCQDLLVAGVATRIRHAPAPGPDLAPIFAHLEGPGPVPDVTLDVIGQDGDVQLFRDGDLLLSCPREEAATALKAQVMNEVLGRGTYELALHAAALLRGDRMLLFSGRPGAGKTTLALALAGPGFGFAGDDLVLLAADGRATGVPFAPAVKPGAWDLLADLRPDIGDAPVFRRPDRKRVRYPLPQALVPGRPHPVGWLMQLDRRPGAKAGLTPVDSPTGLRWMLQDAYAEGRVLTPAGFEALRLALRQAQCHRLTYSRLEDAVELLHETCR